MELDMLVFTIHLASRLSMSCVKEQGVGFPESATCTSPNPLPGVAVPIEDDRARHRGQAVRAIGVDRPRWPSKAARTGGSAMEMDDASRMQ